MGRQQKKQQSLRSKAFHFVSDLTTGLLNPISDKPPSKQYLFPPPSNDMTKHERSQLDSISEEGSEDLVDGPDTSSFTAFLYSFLSSSGSGGNSDLSCPSEPPVKGEPAPDAVVKGNSGKKSLFSRGKQSLRAIFQVARLVGSHRSQASTKDWSNARIDDLNEAGLGRNEGIPVPTLNEDVPLDYLPETSEPSLLLSEGTRSALYVALPALVQGKKCVLLYSTWRHGISLSTLYRQSMFCPGLTLLVAGDRKGVVFGGLVDGPLKATNKKRHQGTNNAFVFTTVPGHPVIYRPTGVNRYFTLCSSDCLALGGGGHFALYLDGDLLNGSSSASETYGNSCLAHTEDFEVKEVEFWGFLYASKYEEIVSSLRTKAPGICCPASVQ